MFTDFTVPYQKSPSEYTRERNGIYRFSIGISACKLLESENGCYAVLEYASKLYIVVECTC